MLESLFLGNPSDPTARLVQEAMKDYFTLKKMDDASDVIGSRLFGSGLDRQNQELDVALKRRQLELMGGPQDSEAFNDTPASSILAAMGITWAKDLQPPKVSSGLQAPKSQALLRALMDEGSTAKELGNVGSSLGRSAGRLGKYARFASLF